MNLQVLPYLISLVAALITIFVLFRIVKRTEKALRLTFTMMFAAFVLFALFSLVSVTDFMVAIDLSWLSGVVLMLFATLALLSVWRMVSIIRDVTDRGQVMIVVPGKDHIEKLISSLKGLRGSVCYASLMEPCEKSRQLLGKAGVNTKKVHFIGSSGMCDDTSEIICDPEKLIRHLLSELGEKDFDFLVVDDLSSLKITPPMELEEWVSRVTAKAQEMRTQSIFFCNKDNLPSDVIDDLGIFMDKVTTISGKD